MARSSNHSVKKFVVKGLQDEPMEAHGCTLTLSVECLLRDAVLGSKHKPKLLNNLIWCKEFESPPFLSVTLPLTSTE